LTGDNQLNGLSSSRIAQAILRILKPGWHFQGLHQKPACHGIKHQIGLFCKVKEILEKNYTSSS